MIRNIILLILYILGIYITNKRKDRLSNLKYIYRFFWMILLSTVIRLVSTLLSYKAELLIPMSHENGVEIFGIVIFVLAYIEVIFDILAYIQIIKYLRRYTKQERENI